MEAVHFCSACGRMLESEYIYCPYCGTQVKVDSDLAELIEEPFLELEQKAEANTLQRLCRMEKVLVSLEKDLDEFLSRG